MSAGLNPERSRCRYPLLRVRGASADSLVLVAEVRYAMWRAKLGCSEIDRFTRQALSSDDADRRRAVCHEWVELVETETAR